MANGPILIRRADFSGEVRTVPDFASHAVKLSSVQMPKKPGPRVDRAREPVSYMKKKDPSCNDRDVVYYI